MEDYNPYALLEMTVNGTAIYGRPTEFDSEVANPITLLNGFGNIIKPVKVSTVCPDCGQGLLLAVELGDPPYQRLDVDCPLCKKPEKPKNPFVNPITSGRIAQHELDPLLHNPRQQIIDDGKTLAERVVVPTEATEELSEALKQDLGSETAKKPKAAKKPKKKATKPIPERIVPLPPADDISEELDDLAEPE